MKATNIQSHSAHNLQSQLGQRNKASYLSGFCTMSLLTRHGHPIDYAIHNKKDFRSTLERFRLRNKDCLSAKTDSWDV